MIAYPYWSLPHSEIKAQIKCDETEKLDEVV